ncbi:CVNH domain-containing protein [Ophiocordyceps camponoti-floridani]|uniref:CVNH domain-containing protein n=1 Tax=Ophiocordyceps camponoti-floridani TaxID=2030778 RepID=A0A8H4VES3_9HYPO|nr:CVNH domain-containing protein [Ophiocordyceps camponoti-floridani]
MSKQCHFVGFSDGTASRPVSYTGKCSQDGTDICSRLDLSHCLTNQDGYLSPPLDAEGFKTSCPSCHVEQQGQKLFCICQRADRSFNYTWVDLDGIIDVREGLLTCSTTKGQKIAECPVTRIGQPPTRRVAFVA